MRLLIGWMLSFLCAGAMAATAPYVQVTGPMTGLANTCAATSTPVAALVNMDVPQGSSYQYSIFFLIVPDPGMGYGESADMHSLAAGKHGGGPAVQSLPSATVLGIEPPPQGPGDPYYGLLYTSTLRNGPSTASTSPLNLSTPGVWYASAPPLPQHTVMLLIIGAYPRTNAVGDPVATASIKWDCTTGVVSELVNSGDAAGLPSQATNALDAVEFYDSRLDHYFISASPAEISDLDSGHTVGWSRTGLAFKVLAGAGADESPVCRFYIPPASGDSHFYSASPAECATVKAQFPSFVDESDAVFYVKLPDQQTGACPADTRPVYRLWNRRADSNHRYTTDPSVKAQMIGRGYVAEGYGADAVAMCTPP
jgi:hypothetical protein